MKRRFSRCKTFNQCEKKLTCSILSLYSPIYWNLVGSILGRSSIQNANLVPILKQTWPPQAILFSDWLIYKNRFLCNCLAKWSETLWWFFFKSTNQKQEFPVAVMFVNGSEIDEQLYRGPSMDASYQILIHLAKRFQRRLFRNQPIRNKNCLWRTCLVLGRKHHWKVLYPEC
jgi:hypothetical protein